MHVSAAHLLHIAFGEVMPQCCRMLCFRKAVWPNCSFSSWAWLHAALLQMLGKPNLLSGLSNSLSESDDAEGEEGSSNLLLCRFSHQTGYQGGGNDEKVTERALTSLKPCWWVQLQHTAIFSGTRIYLIHLIFFLWGGVRGVGWSVSSVTSITPHCNGSRNAAGR